MDVELEWIGEGASALDGGAAPSPPSPFVGRRRELDALEQALEPGARLIISAEGHRLGAGRSAVAWELARRAGGFAGGVLWWSIERDGAHPQRVMHRWARQIGAPRPAALSWSAVEQALAAGLAAHADAVGEVLVVIDGVQGPQVEVTKALLALLPASCAVVLTTDDATATEAFVGTHVALGPMPVVDGLRLLRSEARARLPQNAAVAAVEAVDGLPLGVRLVARRFQYAAPADVDRLTELPEELAFEAWTVERLEGVASMARLFFVLYQGLDPRAQQVFRWVSALHGKAIDAARLAGLVLRHEEEVRQDLEEIGFRGLLEMAPTDGVWHVHPLLGRWAQTLLGDSEEAREAADRHLAHFRLLAEELSRSPARARAEILDVGPELLGASRHARATGAKDDVLGFAEGLGGVNGPLVAGLFLTEAAELLAAALEIARGDHLASTTGLEAALAALGGEGAAPARGADVAAEMEADLELLRAEAMLALSEISLEVEGALAQVQVWVEGALTDAAGREQRAVLDQLALLEALGAKAEQRAESVHRAVDDVLSASARAVRSMLADAERAKEELSRWALDAERRWTELQGLLAEADSEAARVGAVVERARQEVAAAAELLEQAREGVKAHRAELPANPKGPAAEAWAGVPVALGAAMEALRAAEAAADGAGHGGLSEARAALELVRARRAEVAAGCEDALRAAAEAVRISQMASEQKASLSEATDHARRSREAAARFGQLRDKVRALLVPVSDTAAGAELLARLEASDKLVQARVAVVLACADRVRTAATEPERRKVLREAKQASTEVSGLAVEALALVPEAEELSARLLEHADERRLDETRRVATERAKELGEAARAPAERLAQLRAAGALLSGGEAKAELAAVEAVEARLSAAVAAAREGLAEAGRARSLGEARAALGAAERQIAKVGEERSQLDGALARAEAEVRGWLAARLAAVRERARASVDDAVGSLQVVRQAETSVRRMSSGEPAAFAAPLAAAAEALALAERGLAEAVAAAELAAAVVSPVEGAQHVAVAERGAEQARAASLAASEALEAAHTVQRGLAEQAEVVELRRVRLLGALRAARERLGEVGAATGQAGSLLEHSPSAEAAALVEAAARAVTQADADLEVLDLVLGTGLVSASAGAEVEASLVQITGALDGVSGDLLVAAELHAQALAWVARREQLQAEVEQQLAVATDEVQQARALWEQARSSLGEQMGGDARRSLGLAEHHGDESRAALRALGAAVDEVRGAASELAAEQAMLAVDDSMQAVGAWTEQVREAVREALALEEAWRTQRGELSEAAAAQVTVAEAALSRWRLAVEALVQRVGPRPGPRTEQGFVGLRELLQALLAATGAVQDGARGLAEVELIDLLLVRASEVEERATEVQRVELALAEAVEAAAQVADEELEQRRRDALVRRAAFVEELGALAAALAVRVERAAGAVGAVQEPVDVELPAEVCAPLAAAGAAVEQMRGLVARMVELIPALNDSEDGQRLLEAEALAAGWHGEAVEAERRVEAQLEAYGAALHAFGLRRLVGVGESVHEVVERGGAALTAAALAHVRARVAVWSHLSLDLLLEEAETLHSSAEALRRVGEGLVAWLSGLPGWPDELDAAAVVAPFDAAWAELIEDHEQCLIAVEAAHQAHLDALREEVTASHRSASTQAAGWSAELSERREAAEAQARGWDEPPVRSALDAVRSALSAADAAVAGLLALPASGADEQHEALRAFRARVEAALAPAKAAMEPVRAAGEALVAAIDDARLDRVASAVSVGAVCGKEAQQARLRTASARRAAEREVLGLESDESVRDICSRLAALDGAAGEQLASLNEGLTGLNVMTGHAEARTLALAACAATGGLLRGAYVAHTILEGLRSALASAATDQLGGARRRVEDAVSESLDAESEAAEQLNAAREAAVQWDEDAQARAALAEVAARTAEVFEVSEACQAAAVVVARTASLRQAWDAAAEAGDALARLGEVQRALDAAHERLRVALVGAEARFVERARDRVDEARQRIERAVHAARAHAELAEELLEGWTLADVRQAASEVQRHADAAAGALAGCEVVLTAVLDARDREGCAAALEDARELEAAGSESEGLAEQRLNALRALQAARFEGQVEHYVDAASTPLADADEAMVRAVIARATGEEAAASSTDSTVCATLAEIVQEAERAERLAEAVRGLHGSLSSCASIAEVVRLAEQVRVDAVEVVRVAERAESLRDRLDRELAARAALEQHLARSRAAFDLRCGEAQVAYDELELTLEATRVEFEGDGIDEHIRARWERLEQVLVDAHDGLVEVVQEGAEDASTLDTNEVEQRFAGLYARADGLVESVRDALEALPLLVDDHARFTRETGEKLRARMTVRVAVARARGPVHLVNQAARRALDAAVGAVEAREAWVATAALRDAVMSRVEELTSMAERVRHADAEQAVWLASRAETLTTEVGVLTRRLVAASALAQRETLRLRNERSAAQRARRANATQEAIAALKAAGVHTSALRAWRRQVSAWERPWREVEVRSAALDFRQADLEAEGALAAVRAAVSAVFAAPDASGEAVALERLRVAAQEQARAIDLVEQARAAVGSAVVAAHAARTAARDAVVERQRSEAAARGRVEAALGRGSATRRIPLFEKGLAVARLRGDESALIGWLLDTAELYREAGRLRPALKLLDEAIERVGEDRRRVRARLLEARAEVRLATDDAASATADAAEGIRLARGTGDEDLEASLLGVLGRAARAAGDVEQARGAHEAALVLLRPRGPSRTAAVHLASLARMASDAGAHLGALRLSQEAEQIYRAVGDMGGCASELGRQALLTTRRGEVSRALSLAGAALDLARRAGDEVVVMVQLGTLGQVWLVAGRPMRARALLQEALQIAERRDDQLARGWLLGRLAAVSRANARGVTTWTAGTAWAASKDAVRRARRGGQRALAGERRPSATEAVEAVRLYEAAAQIAARLNDPSTEGRRLLNAGAVLAGVGDRSGARGLIDRAEAALLSTPGGEQVMIEGLRATLG